MKAVQVKGPKVAELVELPAPKFTESEVAIDILAVGICGTDIEIIDGNMAYYTSGQANYPIVIGHEWVGAVTALGADVSGFEVGDHVVGEVSIGCRSCPQCLSGAYHRCPNRTETGVMERDGGLAEKIVCPAWSIHKISKDISVGAAALVEPTAIAYNGVRLAGVSPGKIVAIIGDGPIGLLLLQVSKAFAADKVVVIGADNERLALAATFGADAVIDSRTENVLDLVNSTLEGKLVDVVFEASGNPKGLDSAIDIASPGAIIVLQGLCGCRPPSGFDLDSIVVNDLTLRGALGSPGIWPEVVGLIESGRVDPAKIVSHDMPMSKFEDALQIVKSRKAVKLVLRPTQ